MLDGWLRRLAAREAQCRTVLGTLARRFLACCGHHELGFARLGDYSRERLGLSARELQSLATVSARLERSRGSVQRSPRASSTGRSSGSSPPWPPQTPKWNGSRSPRPDGPRPRRAHPLTRYRQ